MGLWVRSCFNFQRAIFIMFYHSFILHPSWSFTLLSKGSPTEHVKYPGHSCWKGVITGSPQWILDSKSKWTNHVQKNFPKCLPCLQPKDGLNSTESETNQALKKGGSQPPFNCPRWVWTTKVSWHGECFLQQTWPNCCSWGLTLPSGWFAQWCCEKRHHFGSRKFRCLKNLGARNLEARNWQLLQEHKLRFKFTPSWHLISGVEHALCILGLKCRFLGVPALSPVIPCVTILWFIFCGEGTKFINDARWHTPPKQLRA